MKTIIVTVCVSNTVLFKGNQSLEHKQRFGERLILLIVES